VIVERAGRAPPDPDLAARAALPRPWLRSSLRGT
jgi:hypothetical protein